VPLAIACLALSFGTCAVAALQAHLPPHKHRFWSRSLIGLLFFLQPILRSWARFKWRTAAYSSAPQEAAITPPSAEVPETFTFWTAVGRLQFLHEIWRSSRRSLDGAGGYGLDDHDLEFFPHLDSSPVDDRDRGVGGQNASAAGWLLVVVVGTDSFHDARLARPSSFIFSRAPHPGSGFLSCCCLSRLIHRG
jgi:hypothetical protein